MSKIPRFFIDASMPTETEADPEDPLFSSSASLRFREGGLLESMPQIAPLQQRPLPEEHQSPNCTSRKP
jgi:hypothetical protein